MFVVDYFDLKEFAVVVEVVEVVVDWSLGWLAVGSSGCSVLG